MNAIVIQLDKEWNYCRALNFKEEFQGLFCCNGKIKLQDFLVPPEPVKSMLGGSIHESQDFLKKIRAYNDAFAMTFLETMLLLYLDGRLQGQLYNRISSMQPLSKESQLFPQIYFQEDYQV